ncbi:MAG: hypothetical protein NC110_02875 [Ruminococcus sp.]|nr:hypothetical protein [Ruminococcus sp.]
MKNKTGLTKTEKYKKEIRNLRNSVLLVVVFTMVDIVLCAAKPLTSFPLTAFCPHFLMTLTYSMADSNTGMLSFYIGIVMAAIIVLAYLILFFMMRKKQRRTISALIFFLIDTVIMIYGIFFVFHESPFSPFIFDIVFHIILLEKGIKGVIAFFKLKKINNQAVTHAEAKEA